MTPPSSSPVSHHVFVDFENVPSVDLAPLAGRPVHVTLLIGEKQKRLTLALVRQIHSQANQITLIEVGASGRNALDLVLAAHLGRASVLHPEVEFFIVSKDKDFDPLIRHLRANQVNVTRIPDFAALPFLSAHRKASKPSSRRVATNKPSTPIPNSATSDTATLDKLIMRLRSQAGPHPKRKDRLLRHIASSYGHDRTEGEIEQIVDELVSRGVIEIDDDGKVHYPHLG